MSAARLPGLTPRRSGMRMLVTQLAGLVVSVWSLLASVEGSCVVDSGACICTDGDGDEWDLTSLG